MTTSLRMQAMPNSSVGSRILLHLLLLLVRASASLCLSSLRRGLVRVLNVCKESLCAVVLRGLLNPPPILYYFHAWCVMPDVWGDGLETHVAVVCCLLALLGIDVRVIYCAVCMCTSAYKCTECILVIHVCAH